MQNPAEEISSVFTHLTMAPSAEIQANTIHRYFTPDAGFRHPFCAVRPALGSRERLLGIYQWYRVISPQLEAEIKSVVYDQSQGVLILEVVQVFHIRLSPLKPAPSRLVVRLTLREVDGLHFIAFQEDFYHPDDLMALLFPPLIPVIRLALTSASLVSTICATAAHALGITGMGSSSNPPTSGEDIYESDSGLYDGPPNGKAD